MTDDVCGNCHFWGDIREGDIGGYEPHEGAGRCRRYPPQGYRGDREKQSRGDSAMDAANSAHWTITWDEDWCGEYAPNAAKALADVQAYRIDREASALHKAAAGVAENEARFGTEEFDYRRGLAVVSARISRDVPHLDRAIRDKAKADAKDQAVIDLLNWAALDTALAEATAQ